MSGPKQPLRGTFVVSWGQTTLGGETPPDAGALRLHRGWTWTGEAVCLATGGARPKAEDAGRCVAEAVARARVVLSRALVAENARIPDAADGGRDMSFTVTDGIRFWTLGLMELPEMPRPLVVFAGEAPPSDRRLIVSEEPRELPRATLAPERRRGAVCFTPGTMIETDRGPRAVETLAAGDRVATRDDGAQEILWVGSRHLTGARLHAFPDLRPVRIRKDALDEGRPEDDLIVSPDHRILLTGPRAQAAWGEPEVLIAARDLIDDRGVTRAHDLTGVTYVHLLLPSHQILRANGTFAESFHPGDADLDMVPDEQRLRLLDVMPALAADPEAYGPRARAVLGPFEAAALFARH